MKRQSASKDEVSTDRAIFNELQLRKYHPLDNWEEPLQWGIFHVAALNEASISPEKLRNAPVLRIEYTSIGRYGRPSDALGPMIGQWISSRARPNNGHIDRVLLLVREPLPVDAIEILRDFHWCKWMTMQDFRASTREQVLDLFAEDMEPTGGTTAPSVLTAAASIPASDRIVRINDNDPTASVLVDAVAEVADVLEKSNSLPVPPDERRVLLREVRGLLEQLQDKFVRLGALQAAVSRDGILEYLKCKFPDHVMSGLVGAAITAIGTLLAGLLKLG